MLLYQDTPNFYCLFYMQVEAKKNPLHINEGDL